MLMSVTPQLVEKLPQLVVTQIWLDEQGGQVASARLADIGPQAVQTDNECAPRLGQLDAR
jgi:hypothetical protein